MKLDLPDDFPIKTGDFPQLCKRLPEGNIDDVPTNQLYLIDIIQYQCLWEVDTSHCTTHKHH